MHRAFFGIFFPRGIDAGIAPYIGAVTAVYAEFYIVDVRLGAVLKHKNQFVLGTVKRAHPRIVFAPYTQIFKLVIHFSRRHHLFNMPPVHTNIMQRAGFAERTQAFKRRTQKMRELLAGHFAGGKFKFIVFYTAGPADMPVNFYIVRRIRKHHIGFLVLHQCPQGFLLQGIAANQAVCPQLPKVPLPGNDIAVCNKRDLIGFGVRLTLFPLQNEVYIPHIIPRKRKRNVQMQFLYGLKLCLQQFYAPGAQLRQTVVGNAISLLLGRG